MKRKASQFFQIFIFVFLFFSIALIFSHSGLFYENGAYVDFLKSFLQDGDFNIINQVRPEMAWLASSTFYHPAFYTESQTGYLGIIYCLEWLSRLLSFKTANTQLQFQLTSLAINIFSLLTTVSILKKISEELKIQFSYMDFVFFVGSSAALYFSLLQTNVLEIVFMPLLSFLFLLILQIKNNKQPYSIFTASLVVGLVFITKPTFWPICIYYLVYQIYILIKKKKKLDILVLIVPTFFLSAVNVLNKFVKHGFVSNFFPSSGLSVLWDFSFENIFTNLALGFFSKGGLFFANPIYFICLIGVVLLLKKLKRENKINILEVFLILLWFGFIFLNQIFILGYVVEDHLPGRIYLATFPLLILGLTYLREVFANSKYFKIFLTLLVMWQIYITFNYILISLVNVYKYPIDPIAHGEVFSIAISLYLKKIMSNLSLFKLYFTQIFIFTILICSIIILARKKFSFEKKIKTTLFCAISVFIYMSISNIIVGPENVSKLKQQGFFADKVIGNGEEIYLLDYVLDMAKTISSRNNKFVNDKLQSRVAIYYERVEQQIIRSVPAFDQAIKTLSLDFSFFIAAEKLREKNAYESIPSSIKSQ